MKWKVNKRETPVNCSWVHVLLQRLVIFFSNNKMLVNCSYKEFSQDLEYLYTFKWIKRQLCKTTVAKFKPAKQTTTKYSVVLFLDVYFILVSLKNPKCCLQKEKGITDRDV